LRRLIESFENSSIALAEITSIVSVKSLKSLCASRRRPTADCKLNPPKQFSLEVAHGKATVPDTAISAFQAAGLLSSKDVEEYHRQFDPVQTKWIGHWHEGSHVEGWFEREEKGEINLKWKKD
jgi:hypothetical protein